tara:strand:- start:1348 stop:1635 length:288 start_codon:yes stop_codon:yes gene_type:complete
MTNFSEFNTNLRNIGLFITLSFGITAYSKHFNKKIKNIFIIISLIFLIIPVLLTLYLLENQDKNQDKKLSIIPVIILPIILIFFILNISLLYSEL